MDLKTDSNIFDINKICRTCLSEKSELLSVFTVDDRLGHAMSFCDMIMRFSSIQIINGDGLPLSLCMDCTNQVIQCFAFKQLCEQSDSNLRQFLCKTASDLIVPSNDLKIKQTSRTNKQSRVVNKNRTKIDNSILGLIDDISDSDMDDDYDFNVDFSLFNVPKTEPLNPNLEKVIAQQQLLKSSKEQKRAKKKSLSNGKPLTDKKQMCKVCKKQFVSMKVFKKHLRSHIEDKPFKCTQCPRAFSEEIYLNNHMRSHLPDDQKPYECKICDKRFIHETLLNRHILKHSGEKPYVCKICNKGCYAENSLIKHMKIHEKTDTASDKLICDYCRTEFPDAQSLDVHIKQHTGDRPFVCNVCGKTFPQRFNLELHSRTHTGERPFQCGICKHSYVSKASLKIHMRTHTNERPFVCSFCGKAFRQSGDLTSHKRLHGTDKPIECELCHKKFTTSMKLKYHMRNHTGERPYVCTICGRGFTMNTILLRHLRVHSGERPYVCVTCGKAFSQMSTLNTHMKIHLYPSAKQQTLNNTLAINKQKQNTTNSPANVATSVNNSHVLEQHQPIRISTGKLTSHLISQQDYKPVHATLQVHESFNQHLQHVTPSGSQHHLLTLADYNKLANSAAVAIATEQSMDLKSSLATVAAAKFIDNSRLLSTAMTADGAKLIVNVTADRGLLNADKYLIGYEGYQKGNG